MAIKNEHYRSPPLYTYFLLRVLEIPPRIGYGTSSMVRGVHNKWEESWKAVCSATVAWHKGWRKPDGWKELRQGSTGVLIDMRRNDIAVACDKKEKIGRCRATVHVTQVFDSTRLRLHLFDSTARVLRKIWTVRARSSCKSPGSPCWQVRWRSLAALRRGLRGWRDVGLFISECHISILMEHGKEYDIIPTRIFLLARLYTDGEGVFISPGEKLVRALSMKVIWERDNSCQRSEWSPRLLRFWVVLVGVSWGSEPWIDLEVATTTDCQATLSWGVFCAW